MLTSHAASTLAIPDRRIVAGDREPAVLRVTPAATAALLALTLVAPACSAPSPAGQWRHDTLWDDGNAELCAYEVTWPRYGNRYSGSALLVLVKEPWAPELDVKADRPRPDGFDVLKLNHVRDVRTGIYAYHQMASVYLRRADGGLEKVAATSSEACGVSTAHWTGGELQVRSYFDGVGDRQVPWPSGAVPEDGLPALLRDWVSAAAPPDELLVVPTLLDSRLADLAPRRLRLSRRDAGTVEVPAGRFAAVALDLAPRPPSGGGSASTYVFQRAPPHPLLLLESSEGTRYRLVKCERLRYWERHHPGGEDWLPPGLR